MTTETEVRDISTTVTYPIPQQLVEMGATFVRSTPQDNKQPIDQWKDGKGFTWDDPLLQEHLRGGGSYLVNLPPGMIVLDIDDLALESILEPILGPHPTLTVRTSRGTHRYYTCDYDTKRSVQGKLDVLVRCLVAGPGSTHTLTGQRYEVLHDLPIATIPREVIERILRIATDGQITEDTENTDDRTTALYLGAKNGPGLGHPPTKPLSYIQKSTSEGKTEGKTDDNSESEAKKVSFWDDTKFCETSKQRSLPPGVSIIRFADLDDMSQVQKHYPGRKAFDVYLTRGDVIRSAAGESYAGNDMEIRLVHSAARALRTLPRFRSGPVMFFRASQKMFVAERIEEDEVSELLLLKDIDIIYRYPRFVRAYEMELQSVRRHKNPHRFIRSLLDGIVDPVLRDQDMISVNEYALREGYDERIIHAMHKTYFGDRYDRAETDAQIAYARRQIVTTVTKRGK